MGRRGTIHKLNWLLETITAYFDEHENGTISKKKLISAFVFENDASVRIGRELIDVLQSSGYIIVKKDNITRGERIYEKKDSS